MELKSTFVQNISDQKIIDRDHFFFINDVGNILGNKLFSKRDAKIRFNPNI